MSACGVEAAMKAFPVDAASRMFRHRFSSQPSVPSMTTHTLCRAPIKTRRAPRYNFAHCPRVHHPQAAHDSAADRRAEDNDHRPLGNGASMCAVHDNHAVATTMGFTALDGLSMGTRCGQLGPGVVLYLMTDKRWARTRYPISYGRTRITEGHVRTCRRTCASSERPTPPAARGRSLISSPASDVNSLSLVATVNGAEAIVFTASIGEHSSERCAQGGAQGHMEWIGVRFDTQANRAVCADHQRQEFRKRSCS